jgi:hypothetical protein
MHYSFDCTVIAGFAAVLAICAMAKPSRAAYKSAASTLVL